MEPCDTCRAGGATEPEPSCPDCAYIAGEIAPVARIIEAAILEDLRRDYPGLIPDDATVRFDC